MPRASSLHLALLIAVGLCAAAGAQPNPYRTIEHWLQPPAGREIGSVSSVSADARGNVWIAERCAANDCSMDTQLAPIWLADPMGRVLRSFGAGRFAQPHGIYVDARGNVWVTDARGGNGRGHQVIKFSPQGEALLVLGEAGVPGDGPKHFNGPTAVVVAANGDVFIADGHEADSNNRVMRFSPDGTFLEQWGGTGSGPGQFRVPHALALDSKGRVFVADRDNNRIQIFDQHGRFIEQWTQFGRPSGIYIAPDDTLYVADNQSNTERNPGFMRGIRIGSAVDGKVTAFIPDPDFDPRQAQETGAHGLAADAAGNLFGAEVWSKTVKKYVRR
jgi:DNA-binding beta-propeller fold protein YncE